MSSSKVFPSSDDNYPVIHSKVTGFKKKTTKHHTINCCFEVTTDYKVMLERTTYQLKYIVAIA